MSWLLLLVFSYAASAGIFSWIVYGFEIKSPYVLAFVVSAFVSILFCMLMTAYKDNERIDSQLRSVYSEKKQLTEQLTQQLTDREKELTDREKELIDKEKELTNNAKEYEKRLKLKEKEIFDYEQKLEVFRSNLTAIPYMSAILADYETYGLEILAKRLDWGHSVERSKKVESIREIRRTAQAMAEKNLEYKYQLAYLLKLYPNLEDVIDMEYSQLPVVDFESIIEYDRSRDWLSKEEYRSLSSIERNQLALDRYKDSHTKTKWQVGRDYELYVGYKYCLKGYTVDYFGSYMGMEDLGRDLIAKKDDTTLVIQCKYWSSIKQIHENHINQLYGTVICYCIENDLKKNQVKGVLVTNIELSPMAKKMAKYLGIECVERYEMGDYPCIKCNISKKEGGITERIYHLPFDQMYDQTKIDKPGEFLAMTVEEAEKAGFRRAFKWFGDS